jgi:hypothetical protein
MAILFFILLLLSIAALILCVIKPSLVIRWGNKENKTRWEVIKIYLGSSIILLILFVSSIPQTPEQLAEKNARIESQRLDKIAEEETRTAKIEAARLEKIAKEEAKVIEEAKKAKEAEEEALMSDAFYTSKVFVEKRLKSPSTADFASRSESKVLSMGENLYVIVSYVDSQNGFGAMIRTKYNIALRYNPADKMWHLENLSTTD